MDKYVKLSDVERAFCGWCGVCLPEEADPARCNDGLFAALRALETVELPERPENSVGEAGTPEDGARRPGAALSREDVDELVTLLMQMADAAWRAEAAQEAAVHAAEAAIAAGVEAEAAQEPPLTVADIREALREPLPLLPLVTHSEAEEDGVPEEPEEGELLQAFQAGES